MTGDLNIAFGTTCRPTPQSYHAKSPYNMLSHEPVLAEEGKGDFNRVGATDTKNIDVCL